MTDLKQGILCQVCNGTDRVAWRSIPATQDHDGAFLCKKCEYFYENGVWAFVRKPYSNMGHFVDARSNVEILPEDAAAFTMPQREEE